MKRRAFTLTELLISMLVMAILAGAAILNIDAMGRQSAQREAEKVAAFIRETGTNDTCHLTFVTTYGLKRTRASCVVQSEVTLDDLFKE